MGVEVAAIGLAAASGGASSAAGAAITAGTFFSGVVAKAALVGAALGAAVGGLSILASKGKGVTQRKNADVVQTTSIRNLPVPIVFGRARMAGNTIAIGNWWKIKAAKGKDVKRKLSVINEVVALCEGPLQAIGNVYIDGRPKRRIAIDEEIDEDTWLQIIPVQGTYNEDIRCVTTYPLDCPAGVLGFIYDTNYGFNNAASNNYKVPWRNTAKLLVHAIVGETPRIPDINVDLIGPDLTIRQHASNLSGSNFDDTPKMGGYDAYTESFYWTIDESDLTTSPFGVARISRVGVFGYQHTPPPTGVTNDVKLGWYLGRHDILLMQDPDDDSLFHIGTWGLSRGSFGWESFRPHRSYANPILAHFLDEHHGILHTVHDDGAKTYIMRWTLLTGRVTRIDLTSFRDGTNGDVLQVNYSLDLDAYLIATSTTLAMIDPVSGENYKSTTALTMTGVRGIFVSGQQVGFVTTSGCYVWDPLEDTTDGPLGRSAGGTGQEHFGATQFATQNSWTGHVSLFKPSQTFINFIVSCVEDYDDIKAIGTPKNPDTVEAVKDGWFDFTPAPSTYFTRDWSWRTYNSYNLVALEGRSSLAAAMWAAIFSETTLDSQRWGGGINKNYGCLSSFESVHSYCVGTILRKDQNGNRVWYAERYKLDLAVDQETSLADIVSTEMLGACNGYRTVIDGKLYVGIHRNGAFPVWHFTDERMSDGSCNLAFLGRNTGTNRVRVQYTNVIDEYRKDYAEANDEYDQGVRGRVQMDTVSLQGIGRFTHADILAKAILDQLSSARRQVTFKTHFLGWLLTPTDVIQVSQKGVGLTKVMFRITNLSEDEEGAMKFTALEHNRLRDAQRSVSGEPPPPGVGDPFDGTECECSIQETIPDDDTAVSWFNKGASYQPAFYWIKFWGGAYQRSDGKWYNAGFDIVTRISGVITVLGTVGDPGAGYDTYREAYEAGMDITGNITLNVEGPIGLRVQTAVIGVDTADKLNPTYELCPPDQLDCDTPKDMWKLRPCQSPEPVNLWVLRTDFDPGTIVRDTSTGTCYEVLDTAGHGSTISAVEVDGCDDPLCASCSPYCGEPAMEVGQSKQYTNECASVDGYLHPTTPGTYTDDCGFTYVVAFAETNHSCCDGTSVFVCDMYVITRTA